MLASVTRLPFHFIASSLTLRIDFASCLQCASFDCCISKGPSFYGPWPTPVDDVFHRGIVNRLGVIEKLP